MTDTPHENEEPLDLSSLTASDIPIPTEEHAIPDHKASRERKRSRLFGKPAGDKADDTPPKRERTRKPPKTTPRYKKGMFVAPLTQMYTTVGVMLMPMDAVCGNAIIQSAEHCAESLDALAEKNDAVRRALWSMTQTTAIGAVLIAHMPILMAVVMHHVPSVQRAMGKMGEDMAETIAQQMNANEGPDSGKDAA